MLTIYLNGSWQMRRTDDSRWIEATVPGTVFHDLMNAGLVPDPFFRENADGAVAPSEYDYEYQRSFTVSPETLNHVRIFLQCHGLDTLTSLFIYDEPVGQTSNMHRFYEFEIVGYPHLCKAPSMFGWDWAPPLPDAGIWRDIVITAQDQARLNDVYITTSMIYAISTG